MDYMKTTEEGLEEALAPPPPYVKSGFLYRVYALLTCQILVTGGICTGALFWHPMEWIRAPQTPLVSMFVAFPILCAIPLVHNKHPWNILCLGTFTVAMSALVANAITIIQQPNVVLEALAITSVIFLSLSSVALVTKRDFSFMGAWLACSIVSLLVFSLIQLFVFSPWLHVAVSWVGVVVFSGYILYDTSMMVNHYGPDDAIGACLNLYLDVLNLFMMLINVLSTGRD